MKSLTHLLACIVCLACPTPYAAQQGDGQYTAIIGNWRMLRSVDAMTDEIHCTGVYKYNYDIQLNKETLLVTVRGGIETVTMRFGDKPARSLRIAKFLERKLGFVIIDEYDFSEVVNSYRLRLQTSNPSGEIANEDLNLMGIREALENIKAGCPRRNGV